VVVSVFLVVLVVLVVLVGSFCSSCFCSSKSGTSGSSSSSGIYCRFSNSDSFVLVHLVAFFCSCSSDSFLLFL